MGRGCQDFGDDGGYVLATPAAVADDASVDSLSGDAAEDVDYAVLEVGEGVAEVAPGVEV